jgi:SAM-dependent methyltransferase
MSWDSVAPMYRPMEAVTFGNALQRARIAWLGHVVHVRRALIVGEGNGRFLEALLHAAPHVRVDCVDASPRMLEVAKKRVHHDPRVRFVCADLRSYEPLDRYDLVVTHFVLDCFAEHELAAIVARLDTALDPGGHWLLADFRIPPGRWQALRARFWLRVMYGFFGVAAGLKARRLVDPTPLLEAVGLRRLEDEDHDAGFIGSALWLKPPARRRDDAVCSAS